MINGRRGNNGSREIYQAAKKKSVTIVDHSVSIDDAPGSPDSISGHEELNDRVEVLGNSIASITVRLKSNKS